MSEWNLEAVGRHVSQTWVDGKKSRVDGGVLGEIRGYHD